MSWQPTSTGQQWTRGSTLGRARFGLTIYKHQSHLPDRWVFHPYLIYDRKARP